MSPVSQAARRWERPRVLLIEDNQTQLGLYSMVLEEAFEVLTATRGEIGYAEACHLRPDVIVIDVILPDVDGLTICARLRANTTTAAIPIIVLTGDDAAYARAQLLRSSLSGVFMKPCPGDRLVAALHASLE